MKAASCNLAASDKRGENNPAVYVCSICDIVSRFA